MSSTVDLRGFSYALEPLLRSQQWQRDALELKLGRIERVLAAARRERERAQAAFAACARDIRKPAGVALEPIAYARGLGYMAALQAEIERRERSLRELEQEKRTLWERYLQQQLKVDITSRHKDECMNEYLLSEQNRLGGEMDRDWLARNSVRKMAAAALQDGAP